MGSGVAVSVFGFRGGSLLGSGEAVYWIPGGAGVSLLGSGEAVSLLGSGGEGREAVSLLGSGGEGRAAVSLLGSGEAVYWVLGRWSVYWVPERGVCAVNLLGSGGLPSVY